MDPALRQLLEGEESEELEVVLKLRGSPATIPHLRVVVGLGPVVTGRVARRHVREVWGHPDVVSFKAPRLLQVEPDLIDLEAAGDVTWRATDARRPAGLEVTGQGVVIGLVDVGCDFAHPHFRHADGSTRFLALWDQSNVAAPGASSPYGYGAVYTLDDINRALNQSQPYKTLGYHPAKADPQGTGAHGTLVMDIAAGNGQTPGSPPGIAPGADLVFVHAASGIMGGLANLGDSVRILEALDFIARTAGGRPWVANISLGRRGGSHDGLSLVEQGMDALLIETPGRTLVLSTGNYFSSQAHASGQLLPGQERTLIWRTDRADVTPNELEIWYPGKDAIILEVKVPGEGPLFRVAPADDCPVLIGGRKVGHIYHRARDPNNGDNHIDIFLRPEAPAGDWQISLIGEDIVDGKFHAWVERDAPCPHCDSRFAPQDTDPYCTTGTLCNGFRTVAVGAFDAHSAHREIAPFSSCGPLRDFRHKPDLVAPGVRILGARSASLGERKDSWLTRMSGTSFAAPHVTGTIALMFEAAGRPLKIHETRRLLLGSTRSNPEGQDEAVRIGSGYLDIQQAVAAARRSKEESHIHIPAVVLQTEKQSAPVTLPAARAGLMTMESKMNREELREPSPPGEEPVAEAEKPEIEELEEIHGEENKEEEIERIFEEEIDPGSRLVEIADHLLSSGGNLSRPADFLGRVLAETGVKAFGDSLRPETVRFPEPEDLFRASQSPSSQQWRRYGRFVEVVARPGGVLPEMPQAGDILVRVAPGEPGLGHLALIAAPQLWRREKLAGAGLSPEGPRPGRYVQVVEGGARPHGLREGFARRLTDTEGRVPGTQMILRLTPGVTPELTEQAVPQVTAGEFSKALNHLGMPANVVNLLRLSPTFMTMATKLDALYVDIWDPTGSHHRLDVVSNFSDGVVTLGTSKRRVLNAERSFTTGSWFQPYSTGGNSYDAIYIEQLGTTHTGKWIEVIAHETSHAFRFANGQLFSPKVTCPVPKTVKADMILSSIRDEILARTIEARVLREIQTAPGGTVLSQYQPTTGSTDQKVVERDFFTTDWKGTYLEHFLLDTLLAEAIVCDKLDANAVIEKNRNVARIPLEKRPLDDYLKDQNYFDPDSGKLMTFRTTYARLRFIRRVIDARWKRFESQHSSASPNFHKVKEKVLTEHASAFFQGVINYTS